MATTARQNSSLPTEGKIRAAPAVWAAAQRSDSWQAPWYLGLPAQEVRESREHIGGDREHTRNPTDDHPSLRTIRGLAYFLTRAQIVGSTTSSRVGDYTT